jgi:hypothetical protein
MDLRLEVVENRHVVPAADECVNEVRTDVAGAAGH